MNEGAVGVFVRTQTRTQQQRARARVASRRSAPTGPACARRWEGRAGAGNGGRGVSARPATARLLRRRARRARHARQIGAAPRARARRLQRRRARRRARPPPWPARRRRCGRWPPLTAASGGRGRGRGQGGARRAPGGLARARAAAAPGRARRPAPARPPPRPARRRRCGSGPPLTVVWGVRGARPWRGRRGRRRASIMRPDAAKIGLRWRALSVGGKMKWWPIEMWPGRAGSAALSRARPTGISAGGRFPPAAAARGGTFAAFRALMTREGAGPGAAAAAAAAAASGQRRGLRRARAICARCAPNQQRALPRARARRASALALVVRAPALTPPPHCPFRSCLRPFAAARKPSSLTPRPSLGVLTPQHLNTNRAPAYNRPRRTRRPLTRRLRRRRAPPAPPRAARRAPPPTRALPLS